MILLRGVWYKSAQHIYIHNKLSIEFQTLEGVTIKNIARLKPIDVSEECNASIFSVKEQAKQTTWKIQAGSTFWMHSWVRLRPGNLGDTFL
jgi:hypothetical protein